ncbi:hypothetical protein KI387_030501, partial [Taxus chinensis]
MKLVSMVTIVALAFSRILRSQTAQHVVGGNKSVPFGFAFPSFINGGSGGNSESYKLPWPRVVAWRKELSNTAHLITNTRNLVQMKYTEEGKLSHALNLELNHLLCQMPLRG